MCAHKDGSRAFDWDQVVSVMDHSGHELLDVLKPYIPALKREGEEVFEGFMKHLFDADWTSIDRQMYAYMSAEEREQLDKQVYSGALQATRAKFQRKELVREVLFRVSLRLLMIAIL